MEPTYFRSESDSCSTIFSCGPMHELCMRKHSISYCYPMFFVDDDHLCVLYFSRIYCSNIWSFLNVLLLFTSHTRANLMIDFYYHEFLCASPVYLELLRIKWIFSVEVKVYFSFSNEWTLKISILLVDDVLSMWDDTKSILYVLLVCPVHIMIYWCQFFMFQIYFFLFHSSDSAK